MITPSKITKFNRTESELQEYFLFCVCVAGKTAVVQAKKLDDFLTPAWNHNLTPFEYIQTLIDNDTLLYKIQQVKLGQYKRLYEIFKLSVNLDLSKISIDDLEKIPGVGPKTSRFFLMHTRRNQKIAVLDTHILKWLNETVDVDNISIPNSTPQTPSRYKKLEKLFLDEANKRGISPSKLDLEIWNSYARV